MSMGKRRRINGAEQDAFHRYWRHMLCYLDRPGVRASIKRGARRRERHEGKQQTCDEIRGDETSATLEYEMQQFDDGSEWWWPR